MLDNVNNFIVNKHTVELARCSAALEYKKCRKVVVDVIKNTANAERREQLIAIMTSLTEAELKYINEPNGKQQPNVKKEILDDVQHLHPKT